MRRSEDTIYRGNGGKLPMAENNQNLSKLILMGSTGLQQEVAVLVVPFPLQGHLNQLLHLSRLLSAQNVPVHYVATTTQTRQALRRVHGWEPLAISNIFFHDIPSLPFQCLPPDPNAENKFPSHLQPFFDTLSHLRQPIGELLRHLSATSRRVVIIHDSLMGSVVQDFVNIPNAESYTFHSVSAFAMFFFLWENMARRPFPVAVDEEIITKLPSPEGCFPPEFVKLLKAQHEFVNLSSGRIYNTCRVIESPFLDLLARPEITGINQKQWALGPFNPVHTNPNSGGKIKKQSSHRCIKWLDKQAPKSVLYVSFGTTTSLCDEQIKELAIGLEKSEVKFIWVLRDADRSDNRSSIAKRIELVPKEFIEKVKGRGLIVRDWAPQLEILGHFATGGFLSHCGWNSCIESISMGVPIAAWPMHSDQPKNTVLIVDVLKIGVIVKDWAKRSQIVRASAISIALRRLMMSEEIRHRAIELSAAVRRATGGAQGGARNDELDSFISQITR